MVVGPLIFTNNVLMSFVKLIIGKLRDHSKDRTWLRGVLALLSLTGVITLSALTGNAIEFNQVSELVKMTVEVVATIFGAHFTYKLIKES